MFVRAATISGTMPILLLFCDLYNYQRTRASTDANTTNICNMNMFNSPLYVHDPIFYSLLSVVIIMQHNVIYAIIFISIVYILAFLVF